MHWLILYWFPAVMLSTMSSYVSYIVVSCEIRAQQKKSRVIVSINLSNILEVDSVSFSCICVHEYKNPYLPVWNVYSLLFPGSLYVS